jgi:hypothetical protein
MDRVAAFILAVDYLRKELKSQKYYNKIRYWDMVRRFQNQRFTYIRCYCWTLLTSSNLKGKEFMISYYPENT